MGKAVANAAAFFVEGNKGDITAQECMIIDKTYISESGLNANDQKITNVADGEFYADSMDAANGSQLYATNQKIDNITQNIDNVNNRVDNVDDKINKVGVGAAALAVTSIRRGSGTQVCAGISKKKIVEIKLKNKY